MNIVETFIVSFIGSFTGTLTAFIAQYWLYKRQTEDLKKLKKSIQNTVRRLKK